MLTIRPGTTTRILRRSVVRTRPISTDWRVFSSNRDRENKSWSELVGDAADVAKAIVGKIVKTGEVIVKGSKTKQKPKARPPDDSEFGLLRPGDLLGGILGRSIGGIVNSVFKGLTEEIAESQRQTKGIYDEAMIRVMNSDKLRSELGIVTCGAPFFQSSSSESINGIVSKRTVLDFAIQGTKDAATVNVDATENANGSDIKIQVQLSSGRVIRLDTEDGNGSGRTIDVEWKDV